jgi:hypothetical protein
MQVVEQLDSVTLERLRKQARFLQGIHLAEFDKDPSSHSTESSRSNVIALQHTVRQMYGEAIARDVVDLITPDDPTPASLSVFRTKLSCQIGVKEG